MQSILGKMTCAVILSITASSMVCAAQTKVNPVSQINWPLITGSGTPTAIGATCTSANYGQSYQNTAVTPNTRYHCASDGWEIEAGGGGTVTSGSGYKIPAYGNAASTTVGPSNVTTDATGNNLNVPGTVAVGTPITSYGFSMVPLSTIPTSWTLDVTTPGTALASLGGEHALGNPSTNGYVLASTTTGTRSWIANGIGSAAWGAITGTLSSQTDLQNALNAKAALTSATFSGAISTTNVTDSALTSGNCVQAGISGLLITPTSPCYSLGGTLTSANVALGSGAGTGASVAGVYGTDGNHVIEFTTGTAPATNAVIFTVTLTAPRSSSLNPTCQWNELEAGTYWSWTSLTQIPMFSSRLATSTTYVFESNSVALPAGTPMAITVSCP